MNYNHKTRIELIKELQELQLEYDLLIAKQRIEENEKKYRIIIESSPIAIYYTNPQGDYTFVNHRWCEMTGLRPEEALGDGWKKGIHPEDREYNLKNWKKMAESNGSWGLEYRLQDESGKITWVHGMATPVKDEQGNIQGYIGTNTDITELKNKEKELRVSKERWRRLVTTSPDYIALHDIKGRYLFLNHYDKGYSEKDVIGKSLFNFIADESKERFSKAFDKCLETKRTQQLDYTAFGDEGKLFIYEGYLVPIIEYGQVINIMSLAKDITKRKQVEEALQLNEALFREFYDNMKSGSAIFTVINDGSKGSDYIIKKINRIGLTMEGKALEEVVGKRFIDIRPTIDSYGLIPVMKKVWETGKSAILPTRIYIDEHYSNYYENYVFKLPSGEVVTLYDDLTESKKAEEVLRESEERLKEAQALGRIGSWEFDIESQKIIWSDQLYKLFDRDPALGPLSTEEEAAYYSPEQVKILRKYARCVIEEGKDIEYELEAKLPEGREGYFSGKMQSVKNASGQVTKLFGTVQDNTARKKAENALFKSEQRVRNITEQVTDVIFMTNKRGHITYISQAARSVFGYSQEEMISMPFAKFLTKDEVPRAMTEFNLSMRSGKKRKNLTFHMNHKDGYTFTGELATNAFYENDKVTGIIGVIRNITERLKAEEEIRKSEYLRDVLLDNLPIITLVLKKQTREIVACNKLAIEAGAVIGKTCYETLTQCSHNCSFCMAPDLWETEKVQQIEAEYIGKYWEGKWVPFSDDLFIHYIMDITEHKLADQEIKKTHEQLKQLYIYQDELIENERTAISREIHDELGQLLSALKIDLGWTKNNVGDKPEIKKRIKTMTDIVSIIIKTVQRISSDLRPGLLDDLGLVPAMEWYIQEFEKRTGIKCHFNSDDIQSTNKKKNLTLYRILQEALTNVIRHAHAKNVSINLYLAEDFINLEIIDDGLGLKQEKINSHKSLGFIGIRERVNQYNGSLNITSTCDKGTKLSIIIPLD